MTLHNRCYGGRRRRRRQLHGIAVVPRLVGVVATGLQVVGHDFIMCVESGWLVLLLQLLVLLLLYLLDAVNRLCGSLHIHMFI